MPYVKSVVDSVCSLFMCLSRSLVLLDHEFPYTGYIKEGFLAVQHAVDKSIMLYHESRAGKELFENIDTLVQRFPYPSHPQDKLLWISSPFIPLMFILMFSSIVLSIMRSIVFEKEKRLKVLSLSV